MRLVMHDRRDGVEERQRLLARQAAHGFGQRRRGEGAGGDDGRAPVGRRQAGDLFSRAMAMLGCASSVRVMVCGERHPVHRQRAAGGQAMRVRRAHDQRTGAAHLLVQQADGVVLPVVGAEGVGADQLRQTVGDVGLGAAHRAHLVQDDLRAGLGRLPGRFAARQAAADDVKVRSWSVG